jgi:hypothetical protein
MSEHKPFGIILTEEENLNLLRKLERVLDPISTRYLETIGVAAGWKCLEIGAGAGSMAQ